MTNKHENKYENLVIHCKSKKEWDWVFDNLPEGYSNELDIQHMYNQYYTCLRLCHNGVYYSSLEFYKRSGGSGREELVKAIISFSEYKQIILEDRFESCNVELYNTSCSYRHYINTGIDLSSIKPENISPKHEPKHKTLELLSKNIATFTKAAKLAGIEEKELDNYSKLLIELSAGGVELSWTFYPNL